MTTIRSFVLIILALAASNAAAAIELVRDGASDYVIVIPYNALGYEHTAAAELQDFLKQATGLELPVVKESEAGAKPRILIRKRNDLRNDAIEIKTINENIELTGAAPRGPLYAVYTFLEDHVGVRFWTGTENFVPKKSTLTIPDIDLNYQPTIRYRETLHLHVTGENYIAAARMKLNGHFSQLPRDWGEHYHIIGWCHTCYQMLPPPTYFAKHPEWYSLHGDKRVAEGGQMCWTNAEMQKEMAAKALERIRKNPNAGIISISQNDWLGPCMCSQCKAIDDANGGAHSASLITGINAIAGIIAKEYPNFLVETLAYQYTRKPPTLVKPAKNVLVRLCSIECNFAQPLRSQANAAFGDDLRNWSKVADNLFIWNYVTNFSSFLIPHPNMRPIGDDLRFFSENHVVGVFEQADNANLMAGDMLPLRCWLQAKLMWNPSLDQDALTREFLNGYYGAAGEHLYAYLQEVNAPAKDPKFKRGCYHTDTRFLTPAAVTKCAELFDAAEKAVADDATLLKRVRRERLALEHVQLLQWPFPKPDDTNAAAACREYETVAKDFCARAKAAGVLHQGEGRSFASYEPGLVTRYEKFIPPTLPKPGEALPASAVDLQEDQFQLQEKGKWADLTADESASNGMAARMGGGHTNWAVQYAISKDANFGKGPWRVYFVIRADVKKKAGKAFSFGVHDFKANTYIAIEHVGMDRAGDNKYHPYGLRIDELKPGMAFWVSPPGTANVEAVYVDRIYVRKE